MFTKMLPFVCVCVCVCVCVSVSVCVLHAIIIIPAFCYKIQEHRLYFVKEIKMFVLSFRTERERLMDVTHDF